MIPAVLVALWAQADPSGDLIRSGYAQLGAVAILLAFGWWEIRQANKRTDEERQLRIAEVAQERAERREAEARERKLAEVVLPALHEANRALEMTARLTDRGTKT